MSFTFGHCDIRERHGESETLIPRSPLVHVMRTEKLSRLPGQEIEITGIKIGKIHRHSLGRPKSAAGLFHRVFIARLRHDVRTTPAIQDRDLAKEWMLHAQ